MNDTTKLHAQLVTFATKLRTIADVTGIICDCVISRFSGDEDLGKRIERLEEEAGEAKTDEERSRKHNEALALERKLASQTPEPAIQPEESDEVTSLNWQAVICSCPNKVLFGKTMGEIAGHCVKLTIARRNLTAFPRWMESGKAVLPADLRTLDAYRFAEAFTMRREGGELPASASTTASEAESNADTAEAKPDALTEPVATFDWRKVMFPFKVGISGVNVEGKPLGEFTPKVLAFIHKNFIAKEQPKFPIKTKAELLFKAAMALALAELNIEE